MRKKIFAAIGIAAFAAVIAFNINAGIDNNANVNLALANVEALANGEGGTTNSWDCYATYNNCWFWDCSTIYRCGSPCTDAKADSYSDKRSCDSK